MGLLDSFRNALQKPALPAGDPLQLAARRAAAYRKLFVGEPIRVLPHDQFQKPAFGGRLDVHLYEMAYERETGQVQVAVTSGMSDYLMLDNSTADGPPRRRELIQYFRDCKMLDLVRLHDMAWVPLAQGFALDFFHTVGSYPSFNSAWPNALFLPSLVKPHAEFELDLGEGEPMQLLWHVPLSEAELNYKAANGVNALLQRMGEVKLPWIFDENNRPALV